MKNKTCHTVVIIPEFNRIIVETKAKSISLILVHIYPTTHCPGLVHALQLEVLF